MLGRNASEGSTKGRLCPRWWARGRRRPGRRDRRFEWGYIFATVKPATGADAALVLPEATTATMNLFLAEFAAGLPGDAHAVLVLDSAGWHGAKALTVPANITLVRLPPYSPELGTHRDLWIAMGTRKPGRADLAASTGALAQPPRPLARVQSRQRGRLPSVERPSRRAEPLDDSGRGDARLIVQGCRSVQHCRDQAATVSEQDWYSLASVVSLCENGSEVFHELSRPYPRYDEAEASAKLEHARTASRPKLCATIEAETGGPGCKRCSFRGTINSPYALAFADSGLLELQTRYVLDTQKGMYLDTVTGEQLAEKTFDDRFAHRTGKKKPHNAFVKDKRSPKADASDYRPDRHGELMIPENGRLLLNLYHGGGCEPAEGDC